MKPLSFIWTEFVPTITILMEGLNSTELVHGNIPGEMLHQEHAWFYMINLLSIHIDSAGNQSEITQRVFTRWILNP